IPVTTSEAAPQQARRKRSIATAEASCQTATVPPDCAKPKDVAGFRDLANATTPRLKEWLDMCEYEMTRSEPGTVTYDEARRDIGLIEGEMRRRGEAS